MIILRTRKRKQYYLSIYLYFNLYVKYNAGSTIVVRLTNQIMQHAKVYKTPGVLVINYKWGTTGTPVIKLNT